MKKNLAKLVSFNTVSANSNLALISYCQKIFKSCGYKTTVIRSGKKADLFAFCAENKSERIILSAHTDTVPPSSEWKLNPFCLTERNGRYYGLGVNDMKGFIGVMLELAKKRLPVNFLLTFNEETDFAGVKLVNQKMVQKNDIVIIGEATNNRFILAHKGAIAYKIEIIGKGAHGSEPKKGISSIVEAAKLILWIKQGFKKLAKEDKDFTNPLPTYNFGTIEAGSAINKVPEKTTILFETRITSPDQIKKVDKLLRTYKSKAKIRIDNFQALDVFKCEKSFKEKLKSMRIRVVPGVSYATEAAVLNRLTKNILIFGPGNPSDPHTTDESISISDLTVYLNKVQKLISDLM